MLLQFQLGSALLLTLRRVHAFKVIPNASQINVAFSDFVIKRSDGHVDVAHFQPLDKSLSSLLILINISRGMISSSESNMKDIDEDNDKDRESDLRYILALDRMHTRDLLLINDRSTWILGVLDSACNLLKQQAKGRSSGSVSEKISGAHRKEWQRAHEATLVVQCAVPMLAILLTHVRVIRLLSDMSRIHTYMIASPLNTAEAVCEALQHLRSLTLILQQSLDIINESSNGLPSSLFAALRDLQHVLLHCFRLRAAWDDPAETNNESLVNLHNNAAILVVILARKLFMGPIWGTIVTPHSSSRQRHSITQTFTSSFADLVQCHMGALHGEGL